VGHKAAECTKWVNNVEEGEHAKETAVEEVSVGAGVWMIGMVDAKEEEKPTTTRSTTAWTAPPGLAISNMFDALAEDEVEIEVDNEGNEVWEACGGGACVGARGFGGGVRKGLQQASTRRAWCGGYGECLKDDCKGCMDMLRGVEVNAVSTSTGKKAAMKFHVAKVQRPLASAVKVVEAGNRIVLEKGKAYIENAETKEVMPLRVERGTYVFDVRYATGDHP
jgi:hypothetical protein